MGPALTVSSTRADSFTLDSVSLGYPGNVLFENLSLSLGPDPVAIMGPSGSGKSTILRTLSGQHQPLTGHVLLGNRSVGKFSRAGDGAQRIATVHQDYRLVEFLSISQNIALGAECHGISLNAHDCGALLELVGLAYLPPGRLPGDISGGEQQRVAIARALASKCRVLLADEPTGALDSENTMQVTRTLKSVCAERGVLLIVATHDDRVANQMSTRLLVANGRLVELDGSTS